MALRLAQNYLNAQLNFMNIERKLSNSIYLMQQGAKR